MTLPPTPSPGRVLVVDDDAEARAGFVAALTEAGYVVAEAWSVVQAMRLLLSFHPDAVLLDLILPDGNGADVGGAMRAIVTTQRTCVVAVTASAGAVNTLDPASFGARTVLLKPLSRTQLLSAIGECFVAGCPADQVAGDARPGKLGER